MQLTVAIKHFKLELKHPFTISRSTRMHQDTLIVLISDGVNTGYGEAIPYPFYGITTEKIKDSIQKVEHLIVDAFNYTPESFWKTIGPELRDNYFALCALDCAFWDYYAKLNKKTTRSYFVKDKLETPLSNFTIGIASLETMKQKILEQPWPVYKIKLGTEHDVEIVKSLREITDAIFRIDANCAWTVQETLENAIIMKQLGVEFIEQPLKADNWSDMQILKERCVLPVIADESCQRIADIEKCAEAFHGINIKLMKCGGLTPAIKMINLARDHDLKVMAGCMAESSVGISSLVQIASLLDYIDADGALLLKEDIANGVTIENGKIVYSNSFGSGVNSLII